MSLFFRWNSIQWKGKKCRMALDFIHQDLPGSWISSENWWTIYIVWALQNQACILPTVIVSYIWCPMYWKQPLFSHTCAVSVSSPGFCHQTRMPDLVCPYLSYSSFRLEHHCFLSLALCSSHLLISEDSTAYSILKTTMPVMLLRVTE